MTKDIRSRSAMAQKEKLDLGVTQMFHFALENGMGELILSRKVTRNDMKIIRVMFDAVEATANIINEQLPDEVKACEEAIGAGDLSCEFSTSPLIGPTERNDT